MKSEPILPFVNYDVALSAALVCKGFKIQSCHQVSKHKYCFNFQAAEGLHQAVELYWDDKLFLNARGLLNVYQDMMSHSNHQAI